MNSTHQSDLRTLLLEVLSDTRLQAFIQHWRTLGSTKKRLLLRLARTLR
jgi:hypothetical protein